jgi:F0F1-type ATP synthase gamma subunit
MMIHSRYTHTVQVASQDIVETFDVLNQNIEKLSDFDKNAVQSLQLFYKSNSYLTERQYEFLKKINDRNSTEKLEQVQKWCESFNEEMKKDFQIVCEYYEHVGYYSSIVKKWKTDKEYIPTEEQYNQITQNTYAQKLLETYKTNPEFQVGELVTTKAQASYNLMHSANKAVYISKEKIANKALLILDNDIKKIGNIYRYCRAIPLAEPEMMIEIREKDLKRYKKK